MWYLKVRLKIRCIPVVGSILTSLDLEGGYDGPVSKVLSKYLWL